MPEPNSRAIAVRFLLSLLSLRRRGCGWAGSRLRIQGLPDRILNVGFAFEPDDLVHNPAVAVNEKTLRHGRDSVSVSHVILSDQHGIIDSHIFGELGDVLLARVIHRYTYNLQPLRPILLLQFHQPRHFDLARDAPGRPEIQQHGFAAQVRQAHALAVERFQGEIRGVRHPRYARRPAWPWAPSHVKPKIQHAGDNHSRHHQRQRIAISWSDRWREQSACLVHRRLVRLLNHRHKLRPPIYNAKRFRNDSQFEISVKRSKTSNSPNATRTTPLAT